MPSDSTAVTPAPDGASCSGCHGTGLCGTCKGEGKRVRIWIGFFGRERREIVACRTCLGQRTCRMCWKGAAGAMTAGRDPGPS